MAKYVVFSQSEIAAAALESARRRLRSDCVDRDEASKVVVIPAGMVEASGAGVDLFASCSQTLSNAVALGGSGETVVLVDVVRPHLLTAVAESASWEHLIAMLILAFPEAMWIFGTVEGKDATFPSADHSLRSMLRGRERETLFDPTGLREWVRRRTMDSLKRSGVAEPNSEWLPRRLQLAGSIDDEKSYAYYHAYATYRYGFRADVVTTWEQMKMLFGANDVPGQEYSLLLEDMRLNFPDKPASVHLTDLAERGRRCPGLGAAAERAAWRFVISTGQTHHDENVVVANQRLLQNRSYGRGDLLWKPIGGLSDLWERTGLAAELGGGSRRGGNADGFEWPLTLASEIDGKGHAAPGKLLLIAEVLLRRAELIASGPSSIVGAIRAALHATDAIELSTGRTPTTALGGLVLRQELEVRAECAFVGAGFHIGTRRRLEELDTELASVTGWFHGDIRRKAALDARVSTLSRLVLVFRNAGKLEEETACLNALRSSNRKLSRPEWRRPEAGAPGAGGPENNLLTWVQLWLRHTFLGYAEWVMGSLDRLVAVSALWLAILTIVAWILGPAKSSLPDAAANAGSWFLGTSPLSTWSILTPLSWVGTALGVFHLGVLISYLYSLIARK